ncbi:MAG: biotin/lipoyl-containing protein, partial [Acidimicrobiales bacterium]
MATPVVIPKMGMTMKDGTLVHWLTPQGGAVTPGQALFFMVTEKLECEIEADAAGVLHQAAAPGVTLEPGGVVGWLLEAGEAPPAAAPGAAPGAAP